MAEQRVDFFDDRDDADLLVLARAGDNHCADVLWIRLRPSVLAVARSITGNRHDAEDLASEAMAKVFAAIADGQGPSESVLPYLYATMRNLHLSTLRRQSRVGTPLELDEQRVLNLVTVEPDAIESELVTNAFKGLPDRWRYVLWASLVEGRPGNEIATELNIRPSAVHALKSRALEGLRQHYLSEHALLSEEQECAEVHRVLASIARGRARRSTDQNQVWRHLRGCEHCAEGYQEITAINNRIGALLAPAAATLAGFAPQATGAAALGFLQLPAAAGKIAAAAGVAGAIAITGTTLAHHPERVATAPKTSQVQPVAADRAAAAASSRPATEKPRSRASERPAPAAAATPCPTGSPSTAPDQDPAAVLPQTLTDALTAPSAPRVSAAPTSPSTACASSADSTSAPQDPSGSIAGVKPSETVDQLGTLLGKLPPPTTEPRLGTVILPLDPTAGLAQP